MAPHSMCRRTSLCHGTEANARRDTLRHGNHPLPQSLRLCKAFRRSTSLSPPREVYDPAATADEGRTLSLRTRQFADSYYSSQEQQSREVVKIAQMLDQHLAEHLEQVSSTVVKKCESCRMLETSLRILRQ